MKQQHLAVQGVRADLKNAKNSLNNLRRNHPAEIFVYPFHVTDSIQFNPHIPLGICDDATDDHFHLCICHIGNRDELAEMLTRFLYSFCARS